MAYILNIETSTKNCSVSISRDSEIIGFKELNTGGYSHAEMLHPFINEVMKNAKLSFDDLDAISVGKGPGSYTGLRIGVSAAKGLCFANDLPLIAINSLGILAASCRIDAGLIVPMIDARRMEVYSAVFDIEHSLIRETKAEIIDENSFIEYLSKEPLYFLGDGAEKCKDVIISSKAYFIDDKFPSAKNMGQLSEDRFNNSQFENVAYFEPYYLKDFVVTPQKKKK